MHLVMEASPGHPAPRRDDGPRPTTPPSLRLSPRYHDERGSFAVCPERRPNKSDKSEKFGRDLAVAAAERHETRDGEPILNPIVDTLVTEALNIVKAPWWMNIPMASIWYF